MSEDDAGRGRPALAEAASLLLRRAATGDRAALAEIFEHFSALFAASVSTVHAEPAVRDRVCTEAFAQVWRRAREGAASDQPVLWLLEVLCETLGSSAEPSRRPLGDGVLALGRPYRELLLLASAGRYSQPEIAALTGIGEPRLRVILRDALRTLRGAELLSA